MRDELGVEVTTDRIAEIREHFRFNSDAASRDVGLVLDAQQAEIERLQSHVEQVEFCLAQARIVLEHFKVELPNPEHRRIAKGGLIASAPSGTLPGER